MQKDTYFSKPIGSQFTFDESVAPVFDDMLSRSVPFYEESLDLSVDLIKRFISNGKVVDLGCSTGTLLIKLHKKSGGKLDLIGIDNAQAMIDMANKKANAFGADIEFICSDVNLIELNNIDAITANYFLQFIRPPKRLELVQRVYNSLNSGGIFIFSEKLTASHKKLDKIMIEKYLDYKREKGYSDYEISQKRESLENVLIPYTEKENEEMIKSVGFSHIECVLRWNNFATFIAIK